jgi:hypothetical protein
VLDCVREVECPAPHDSADFGRIFYMVTENELSVIYNSTDIIKPTSCGVYLVCVKATFGCDNISIGDELVVYVGSSHNISKRLLSPNHPYNLLYENQPSLSVYTRSYLCDDYIEVEKRFIKHFKPFFNTQHNG